MYVSKISLAGKYNYLFERFKIAFRFLKENDLEKLPVGHILVDGDNIAADVQQYETSDAKKLKFEAHNRFFDIQYVVNGQESIGVADRDKLVADTEFDREKDIGFYQDPEMSGNILLMQGDFAIIPPEEAHKPRCAVGCTAQVKKIVIKVRI